MMMVMVMMMMTQVCRAPGLALPVYSDLRVGLRRRARGAAQDVPARGRTAQLIVVSE